MLADLATEVEAARLLTLRAAYGRDHGQAVMSEASMAKIFASEVAVRCATKAVQVYGGYGYTREFPVERFSWSLAERPEGRWTGRRPWSRWSVTLRA